MEAGILARTFSRPTLEETFDAVRAAGLRHVQLDLACAGLPSMPDEIDGTTVDRIRDEADRQEVTISALSGTYNMIDPDIQARRDGMRRLRVLAQACRGIGTAVIALCTGTRDPDYLWRAHPDNDTPEAWSDMVREIADAVAMAEEEDAILAFEPEVSNVVNSAQKSRRLLDEIASKHLKVVMDGANVYPAGALPRMTDILTEAFDLLGDDIVVAHAKDLVRDGDAGDRAAGTGVLDYDLYISLLASAGYRGGLLLHSLSEEQVPASVEFLRTKLQAVTGGGVSSA